MTLNVNISIDQNQAYGLRVTETDVDLITHELQPGECVNVVMWDGKNLLLEEIPKTVIEVEDKITDAIKQAAPHIIDAARKAAASDTKELLSREAL